MVSRTIMILEVLVALGVAWLLEQPVGSLMICHPRFEAFCLKHQVFKQKVDMEWFGAETQKPTWLFSCHAFWDELRNPCYRTPDWGRTTTLASCIDGRFYGKKEKLKDAQAYPDQFGHAVADVYHRHAALCRAQADEWPKRQAFLSCSADVSSMDVGDKWEDAFLDGVMALLQ